MFGATSLPPVGAVAQLLGMATFTQNANQLTRQLNQINASTQQLGSSSLVTWTNVSSSAIAGSSAFIRSTGVMLAAITALGAGIKAVSEASDLEQLLKNIQVVSKATNDEMANLTSTTIDMSKQFGIASTEIAKANVALAKGGISTGQMQAGATEATLALVKATQGEVDFARAADLVIQGMNQYGIAAGDAVRVSNAITGAANASTASVNDLAAGFKQAVIPPQVGASIEQVSAALAILNSNNLRGEVSGTALRNMFLRLLNPPKDAAKVMEKYGIGVFDAQGRTLGFRNILLRIVDAFKVTGDAAKDSQRAFDAATLFGARQGTAATTFARVGIQAFDDLEKAIREDTDAIAQSQAQLDTFAGQSSRLRASLVALVDEGFLPIAKALTPLTRQLADFIGLASGANFGQGLITFGTTVAGLANQLAPVLAGLEAIRNSVINLFNAAGGGNTVFNSLNDALNIAATGAAFLFGGISLLIDEFGKIPEAVAAVNVALASLPFLATAAAVLVLVSAITAIVGLIVGPFVAAISGIISIIGIVISSFGLIVTAIGAVGGAIVAVVAAIGPLLAVLAIIGVTVALVIVNWDSLVAAFNNSVAAIGSAINQIANMPITIVAAFSGMVIAIDTTINGLITVLSTNFVNNLTAIFNAAGQVVFGFVSVFFSPAMIAVVNIFQGMLQSVASGLPSWSQIWAAVANAIANALNTAAANINQFLSVLRVLIQGVPILREVFQIGEVIAGGFSFVAQTVSSAVSGVTVAVNKISDEFGKLSGSIKANLELAQADIKKFIDEANAAILAQQNAAALAAQRRGERGGPTPRPPAGSEEPGVPPPGSTGGGGAGPSIRELTAEIQKALADIPGAGKALAQMLADIAKDAPERLAPMIQAIRDVKKEISETVVAAAALAHTNADIAAVSKTISSIQGQISRVGLQQSAATIGFDKQLLDLRRQLIGIDQAEAPLKARLADLDAQITKLQRDNLELTRQRLQLQQQMLPIQNQIADIEKQITAAGRANLSVTLQLVEAQQSILPVQQEIARIEAQQSAIRSDDIALTIQALRLQASTVDARRQILVLDQQIAAVANKQLDLQLRRQELLANQNIGNLQDQLDILDKQLLTETNTQKLRALAKQRDTTAAALAAQQDALKGINREQDKKQIADELATNTLEQQKQAIIDQIQPVNDLIDRIQFEQQVISEGADLQKALLEQQKRALEDLIEPRQQQILLLQQELDLEKGAADITIAKLNLEKQALEDQLQPLQDKLDAITRTEEATRLQNEIAITFLEAEKRAIEDELAPLEAKRRAIELQTEEVNLQKEAVASSFEEQKLILQEQLIQEELRKSALEDTRAAQQAVFEQLTLGLLQALIDSKAFTDSEATEVVKRLDLWNDEVDAIQKRVAELHALDDAASMASDFLATLAGSAHDTVTGVQELGDTTDDTVQKFKFLTDELDNSTRPAIENVTKEVDTNHRPAFERLTTELDSHNRPAFNNLASELNRNSRPAFEDLTSELNNNNRPAFQGLTTDLGTNTVTFGTLDTQVQTNLGSFQGLSAELKGNLTPSVDALSNSISGSLTPALAGATSQMHDAAAAADELKSKLDAIPREINVVINIVTRGSIPSGGGGGGTNNPPASTPPPSSTPTPTLPPSSGPSGSEPGGGSTDTATTQSVRVSSAQASAQARTTQAVVFQENNVYTVTANYSQMQTPTSIAQDIRALIQLSQR